MEVDTLLGKLKIIKLTPEEREEIRFRDSLEQIDRERIKKGEVKEWDGDRKA